MDVSYRHNEKGVALALSILALLLLSGIAVGMMYMSSAETTVNSNFKAEETEYFAARAGVEEIRDRMLPKNPNTINGYIPNPLSGAVACANTANCLLPTTMLGNTGILASTNPRAAVLYILQNGITMSDITSFAANSKCPPTQSASCLVDDELCHDFPSYFGSTTNNVRCTSVPTGTTWYSTPSGSAALPYTSVVPAAYGLDWKWVRVTLKANNSAPYQVDSTAAANSLVCWNGLSEVVAPNGTAVALANNSPCGTLNPYANPVYVVTALGVSPSGARRIVQQEIAQTPQNQPAGMFSTSNGCQALKMAGSAQTYSFVSASESTPTIPTTGNGIALTSGGDVGANGNVDISGNGTTVNGVTMTNDQPTWGNCSGQSNGVSGNGNYGTISNIPTSPADYAPTVPAVPNPMPPTTNCSNSNNYCNGLSSGTLTPGSYGNISVSGSATLTLTGGSISPFVPSVYTFNSLSVQGTLVVNGPVIINIAYQGNGNAVNFTGGTFVNSTFLANNFVINYCCSGNVNIAGGANAFAVVNAPNAAVSLTGGSNFYGQILGNTIDDQGGTSFYWDKSANISPVTAPYYEVTLRELSY